ncbi:extracellular solute-binding protein [Oligoflexaceae bacterium]|nr:extracellular solute-binding protein [Oligoflexaceae bacterium]
MLKLLLVVGSLWSGGVFAAEKLPDGLKWQTNDSPPLFASDKAKKGGTFYSFLTTFPLTLRNVGPDANGAFRYFYDRTTLTLTSRHPNTDEIYGVLAKSWAWGKDNKSAYYKIRKNAKWSDGKPVTADDFVYVLEFMRSKHLVAPWYNQYYTDHYDKVVKYDSHTIGIFLHKPNPEIDLYADMAPVAKHFYHPLGKNYVKKYNWKTQVTTGAYAIDRIKKGKSITIKRVKDWWGDSLPIFKNRFNVDKIVFTIVRDESLAFQKFLKGQIDAFSLLKPDYYHEKTNTSEFKKGYIDKLWFYTDKPESTMAFEINTAKPLLADINVRLGFAHAVNVEKVLDKVLRGDYERQQNTTSGYGKLVNKTVKARTYDLAKANSYFDKAGFTKRGADGIRMKGTQRLSAKISYSSKSQTPRLVVMKQELKKAGFEANLHLIDGALGFKHHLEKKHDIAYTGWGAQTRPQYYGRFHSSNANKPQTNSFTNYANKDLDKLIEDYRSAQKIEDKISNAQKIQKHIADAAILVTLWEVPYSRLGYWRWWKFPEIPFTKTVDTYGFDPLDLLGANTGGLAWLDKDEKKKTKQAKKSGKTFPQVINKIEVYKKK